MSRRPMRTWLIKRYGVSERRGGKPARYATGADHKSRRIACRKTLRMHENPIIGGTVRREIDDRRGWPRVGGDRHKPGRRIGGAGAVLRAIDIIDHGEIGRAGALRDLNPHGGG